MLTRFTATLIGALAVGQAGCHSQGELEMHEELQSTVSIDEAKTIIEDHIKQALSVLPDDAGLDDFESGNIACENGPPGTRLISHEYEIVGLEADLKNEYIDTLRSWWSNNGFRILTDELKGNDGEHRFLWVENEQDKFRLTLIGNRLGRLYIISSSPCIWPDGDPPAAGV